MYHVGGITSKSHTHVLMYFTFFLPIELIIGNNLFLFYITNTILFFCFVCFLMVFILVCLMS